MSNKIQINCNYYNRLLTQNIREIWWSINSMKQILNAREQDKIREESHYNDPNYSKSIQLAKIRSLKHEIEYLKEYLKNRFADLKFASQQLTKSTC